MVKMGSYSGRSTLSELRVIQGPQETDFYLHIVLHDEGESGISLCLTDTEDVWEGDISEDYLNLLCAHLKMDYKPYVELTVTTLTSDKLRDVGYECQLKALSSNRMELIWKQCISDQIEVELGSVSLEKASHPKNQLCAIFTQCISSTLHLKNRIEDLESICEKLAQDGENSLKVENIPVKPAAMSTRNEMNDSSLMSGDDEDDKTGYEMPHDARSEHYELHQAAVYLSPEIGPTAIHEQLNGDPKENVSGSVTQTAKIRGDVLILFQSILLPATCIITYIIASSNDHVETILPYISDSGSWPPESCIFGFLLCFYSLCTLIAAYGRWRMMRKYDHDSVRHRLNNIALGAGFTAAIGVLIVATFQQTSVIAVHLIGAGLAFGSANVYMWMHSFISRSIQNIPGFISWLIVFRFFVSFLTTISVLLVPIFTVIALVQNDERETKTHEPGTGKWDSSMKGYGIHIAASSMEWTLVFYASIFFVTYVREFQHVYFGMPVITFSTRQISNDETGHEQTFGVNGPQTDHPD